MLGQLGNLRTIDTTVQNVGFIVGTQKPFVGFLIKNWPLALFAGFAMYGRLAERHKNKELTPFNAMADLGLVLSPLVGIALINNLAKAHAAEEVQQALVGPAPGPT